MSEPVRNFVEYESMSDHNLKASLLNIPEAVHMFVKIDEQLSEMVKYLNQLPEFTARDSFFFVGTFMLIAQRQMRNGFALLLRRMSYDGLLVLRPGLESAVYAYRLFREPALLDVWANRNEYWKEFSQKFRWADYPEDIPFRDELKEEIDRLNDYWAHPSINYFSNTVVIKGSQPLRVHFFDHDDAEFHLVLLWCLRCCLHVLAVFRKIMGGRFPVFLTSTEDEYKKLEAAFDNLKGRYRARAGQA